MGIIPIFRCRGEHVTEAEEVAKQIRSALPTLKSGTLRFWGQWFGRPFDNLHSVVGCNAQGELLQVFFNEGETLSVWAPRGAAVGENVFRVGDAERVRWEWFYYGRPRIPANLYFEEYVKSAEGVSATTNVDWYTPDLRPDLSHPAVEIVSIPGT
jgi:hypothetical protein